MPSFGESMKRERELRQITLREISEATKINLRYLDALERNDFRHLPGGVFNKGFVRAFAQYIGIDPESMVTAYLQEEQNQQERVEERRREALRRTAGAEPVAPGREARVELDGDPARSRALRIAGALAILGVLVAIVLLVVFLQPRARGTAAPPPAADSAPSAPAVSPSEATAPETVLEARVIVVRKTPGALNCDDRDRRDLGELLPGAEVMLRCSSFLVVDAEDGGAIRLGIGGAFPETLGPDGQPVRGHRIDVAPAKASAPGGNS